MYEETICAPATPPVHSPIGIIRISGPDTLRAVSAIFSHPERLKPRTTVYGSIHEDGSIIDDSVTIFYKSPFSFTGEDMAEIYCHGNPLILNRILMLLHRNGVRMAEPGEFSKRAFLNGKIDLTGAEAINHIITARSQWEIDASIKQMHGSLKKEIEQIRDTLITLKADLECGIDFIDEDIEFISYSDAIEKLGEIKTRILDIRKRCSIGERISRGIDLPIVGKPNVGKSSILNCILNAERALVSDIPGTTRDLIREIIQIGGIHINLVDTAGIDDPVSELDKLGIELSDRKIESSSLVVMVIDATSGVGDPDRRILSRLRGKNVIYVINKTDIADSAAVETLLQEFDGSIAFSAKTGLGLQNLEKKIALILRRDFIDYKDFFVADSHMLMLLEDSSGSAENIMGLLVNNEPLEIIAFEMNGLLEKISGVIGEVTPDDILNSIFSRFCIGK